MMISIETFMLVSLAFAVFAAITAIGASILLSVGYERLRNTMQRLKEGLDLVSRQTGFFAEALHRLDQKVDTVETNTQRFSDSIDNLQTNVDRVDRQTGHFSNTLHQLEEKLKEIDVGTRPITLQDLMDNPESHDDGVEAADNEDLEVPALLTISSDILADTDDQSSGLEWAPVGADHMPPTDRMHFH